MYRTSLGFLVYYLLVAENLSLYVLALAGALRRVGSLAPGGRLR